jgi:RPEL repeat
VCSAKYLICPEYNFTTPFLMTFLTDIERQISLRSTREELIKRGILKEINDNTPAECPVTQVIPEEAEDCKTNGMICVEYLYLIIVFAAVTTVLHNMGQLSIAACLY